MKNVHQKFFHCFRQLCLNSKQQKLIKNPVVSFQKIVQRQQGGQKLEIRLKDVWLLSSRSKTAELTHGIP